MKKSRALSLCVLILLTCLTTIAQNQVAQQFNKCASDRMLDLHKQQHPEWEAQMKKNIALWTKQQKNKKQQLEDIVIPVVVHVLHNVASGEIMGNNISDEQIISQIDRLNIDYSGQNADIDEVPVVFQGDIVMGGTGIQFCLAAVDPDGLPTNGITRTFTSVTNFNVNAGQVEEMKFDETGGKDAWPRCNYLNIWVVPSLDGGFTLGYAQFPSTLTAATDGVVLAHNFFGDNIGTTATQGGTFNEGRTTTHEIGHYFGLFHTFEGGCSSQDLVSDTPPQASPNFGCPSTVPMSCGTPDMFVNYMDYSDDACLLMFTPGQSELMQSVLANDPTRSCLLNSLVCSSELNASFEVNSQEVCVGESVEFSGLPFGNPSGYQWNFEGGNPTSSFEQNPVVQYDTPGSYDVELIVSNAAGDFDILTEPDYITVFPAEDCPETSVEPCTSFIPGGTPTGGGPFVDLNPIPCGNNCAMPVSTQFEVFSNEAYTLQNLTAGSVYNISICDGPGVGSWLPLLTVAILDEGELIGEAVAVKDSCAMVFTVPTTGNYVLVITEQGNCDGGQPNGIDNGFITISCLDSNDCLPEAAACANFDALDTSFAAPSVLPTGGDCGEPLLANSPVLAGQAYLLEGLEANNAYNFNICEGEGAGSWTSILTIAQYDGTAAGDVLAFVEGCTLDFLVPDDGDYLLIVSELGECDTAEPTLAVNGELMASCLSATSECANNICTFATSINIDMGAINGPYDSSCANSDPSDPELDFGECFFNADPFNNTLWFSFEGTGNSIRISSSVDCGNISVPHEDTQMAVFAGFCNGDFVTCNDDIGANLLASVDVATEAGVTYFLAVDGFNGATGQFCLSINESADCTTGTSSIVIPTGTIGNGTTDEPYLFCADGTFETVADENFVADEALPNPQIVWVAFIDQPSTTDILNDPNSLGIVLNSTNDSVLFGSGTAVFPAEDLGYGTYVIVPVIVSDTTLVVDGRCTGIDITVDYPTVTFLDPENVACTEGQACTDYMPGSFPLGGPFVDVTLGYAMCGQSCNEPFVLNTFEVYSNEAYTMDDLFMGNSYNINICDGPNAGNWAPVLTVASYDSETLEIFEVIAFSESCSVDFTVPADGDYLLIITEQGKCDGAAPNGIDNGFLMVTCLGVNLCGGDCANNECSDAALLDISIGAVNGPYDSNCATSGASDPAVDFDNCFFEGDVFQNTLWFSFEGTGNTIRLLANGECAGIETPHEDTQMAIFTGTCNDLAFVACNDDINAAFVAGIDLATEVGTTYYVVVDGFNGTTGEYCILIEEPLECTVGTTNIVMPEGTAGSGTSDEPYVLCADASFDLIAEGDWTVNPDFSAPGLVWLLYNESPSSADPTVDPNTDGLVLLNPETETALINSGTANFSLSQIDVGTYYIVPLILPDTNMLIVSSLCTGIVVGEDYPVITFVDPNSEACGDEPPQPLEGCTEFVAGLFPLGGPFSDFNLNSSLCGDDCAEPLLFTTFEVYANEAYTLFGVLAGSSYNINICTGPNAGSWPPLLTIAEYNNNLGEVGNIIAFSDSCSIDFTIPADGDYILVITEQGTCEAGLEPVQQDNGNLMLTCLGTNSCFGVCDNNICDGAIALDATSGNISTVFNNGCAGSEASDPNTPTDCFFGNDAYGHTMWFSFEGDGSVMNVQTSLQCAGVGENPLFDTQMAIYTGNCGNLTFLACNDDEGGGSLLSSIQLQTEAGQTYYIVIDGFEDNIGDFCLTFNSIVEQGCDIGTFEISPVENVTGAGISENPYVICNNGLISLTTNEDWTVPDNFMNPNVAWLLYLDQPSELDPFSDPNASLFVLLDAETGEPLVGSGTADFSLSTESLDYGTYVIVPFLLPTAPLLVPDTECSGVILEGNYPVFTFLETPTAGTMPSEQAIVCAGESTNVSVEGANVPTGFVGVYVLHTNADPLLGTVLATNTETGNFSLSNSTDIQANTVYYISYVISRADEAGDPTFDGECLEITAGTPVVFLAPLGFDFDGICDKDNGQVPTYLLTVMPTGGLPAFDPTQTYAVSGDFAGEVAVGETFTLTYPATGPGGEVYNFSVFDECQDTFSITETYVCSKTPIELLYFTGEALTTGNLLKWVTASETNNEFYTLERTSDGSNEYEEVAIIAGAGLSQTLQAYEFLDKNAPAGLIHYRLWQTDFDGTTKLAGIVSIQRGEARFGIIQVRPVPIVEKAELIFTSERATVVQAKLYTLTGQLLQSVEVDAQIGVNTISLDMQPYPSGVFMLSLQDGVNSLQEMIVKQ